MTVRAHSRPTKLPFAVVATVTLLVAGGCESGETVAPQPPDRLLATYGQTADLYSFADMSVVGDATLNRNSQGVGARAVHDGLGVRSAVTVWAVVFNERSECAAYPAPCGLADLGNPLVMADVLRLAGNVVDGRNDAVGGRLREGDASESIASSIGLLDAMTAEIHLIFRSHGPPIPGMVDDQIHSVLGGCTAELAAGEIPDAEGECSDVAFAIFQ